MLRCYFALLMMLMLLDDWNYFCVLIQLLWLLRFRVFCWNYWPNWGEERKKYVKILILKVMLKTTLSEKIYSLYRSDVSIELVPESRNERKEVSIALCGAKVGWFELYKSWVSKVDKRLSIKVTFRFSFPSHIWRDIHIDQFYNLRSC